MPIGPSIEVKKRCSGCDYEKSESYAVQGDSGYDVYCIHPSVGKKHVGDTNWTTPPWCPADSGNAAIDAQNEKMRAFVTKISEQTPEKPDYWSSCGQCEHNSSNAEDLLELPDLATPVLNRIRAEGMRMAAEILIDPMDRAAAQKICAQADELEKS